MTAATQPEAHPGITENSVFFHLYTAFLRFRVTTTCSGDAWTCSWGFVKVTSIHENWAFSVSYWAVTSTPEGARSGQVRAMAPAGHWPEQGVFPDYVPQNRPLPTPFPRTPSHRSLVPTVFPLIPWLHVALEGPPRPILRDEPSEKGALVPSQLTFIKPRWRAGS